MYVHNPNINTPTPQQLTLNLIRRGVLGEEHRVPEPVLQFLLRGPRKASVQVRHVYVHTS